jgi:hypothetical protein
MFEFICTNLSNSCFLKEREGGPGAVAARVSVSSVDGKTGTGMSIESSSADVVGVDMIIRELLLRNKGGDDDDDDDDDNGCVRNGRRLHHSERLVEKNQRKAGR